MNQAKVICDVCGRGQAADSEGLSRLNYCPTCQRFVCATCWTPARATCRQCLLGGTDVTTARLTPRIGETFERSSRVARRVPISVAPKVSSPEPRLTNAAVGSHRRLGGQWWRSVVALAAVLAAAGLFAMNARTADPPAPSTLPVSVPSGLATASQPVAPSPQTSALQTYTVKIGDSLTSIAADVYGDESLWPLIHEANRAAIPDPDNLRVGQPLVIPQR